MSTQIKPTHKAILAYYQTLKDLAAQNVSHEMGLRRAFQTLLADTAKLHVWTFVTEGSFTPVSGSYAHIGVRRASRRNYMTVAAAELIIRMCRLHLRALPLVEVALISSKQHGGFA